MAKQGFKELTKQSEQIISDIDRGKFAPIYILMGEESYYIDKISTHLLNCALSPEERDFNQSIFYGKDVKGSEVVSAARRYPVMSKRQLIVVREAQMMSEFEILGSYFSLPMESTILVICYKNKSIDKRSSTYKWAIKAGAIVVESMKPRDYEISGWIGNLIHENGCNIDSKAIQMIGNHLGADLNKIASEVTKLLTFLPEGTLKIEPEDIEKHMGISKDFNNFELTRAISMRDFKQALLIANYFAQNPKDNPIQVTLSLLFTHFQRIVTYNIHIWQCSKRGIHPGSESDISKLLKLQSTYFLGEYITASKNYPGKKASEIISLIREWDMKSKGVNAGSNIEDTLLKTLLLRISAI